MSKSALKLNKEEYLEISNQRLKIALIDERMKQFDAEKKSIAAEAMRVVKSVEERLGVDSLTNYEIDPATYELSLIEK